MTKRNWMTKACGVLLLWAMAAIALPAQTFTTLHSFSFDTDGAFPNDALVQATDGNLYGIATYGGPDGSYGTVFKITTTGTLTTLNSFDGTVDYEPVWGLVQGTNGDFYGTTRYGGTSKNCEVGCGTIFEITPSGTLTTLHSFVHTDGYYPATGVVQGTDGSFYGVTQDGGANSSCYNGCGTVFKITPGGTLTTLHNFDGKDGYEASGLVQGADGNFYGTTFEGGNGANDICFKGVGLQSLGCGAVYKITPGGTLTTLYNFCSLSGCADGQQPEAGLVQDTNGILYGTTIEGGADSDGTVFSLSVGLKPFVETQPTLGAVGTAVNILGSNLTGATSVTFNGTAAVFTVVSHSLITTTVPIGATTGTVEVVRPNGKGLSNVPFTVLP